MDQFEEFRTSPQAAAYVAALLRLTSPGDDRIRVVLTMRRDYLYACDSFPDLSERLQGGKPSARFLLHRMSRDGLHAVITGPLDLAGTEERDREDLARAVLKDVGDEPGELALLQMALWRTWFEAQGRGPDLVRAYGRIGRVEGALAQAADDAFKRLSPDEQRRAETLFIRLVLPGEAGGATRRVARLEEFDAPTRALAEKLSQVEQWRLLTMQENTVEIAHEQLATQWLRYQRWIANLSGDPEHGIPADARGDDLRLLQSLITDAARWKAAPADEKARYHATGVDLELYQQLAGRRDAWLSEVERRFAAASVDADEQEKKRRKEEGDERERLLLEREAEAERLAETEKERAAAAERLTQNERVRAFEQREAAMRYRRIASAAAVVTAIALIAASVATWFWNESLKAQQLTAMQLLAIQARRAATAGNTPDVIERAGALAIESIALARKGSRPVEVDAVEAAREALIRLPLLALRHGSTVRSLAALPDGRLASSGDDGDEGTIKLWPKDGAGVTVVTDGSGAGPLAVLGGRAAGQRRRRRYNQALAQGRRGQAGDPHARLRGPSLAVLSDGRLASGDNGDEGTIKLWPKDGVGEPVILTHGRPVSSLAVLPDGRLASGGGNDEGTIKLWPKDGVGEPVILAHGSWVTSLAVLPDGRLASGGVDGKIKLWPKDGRAARR